MTDDHATDDHAPVDDAAEAHRPDERGASAEHGHDEMALGPTDIAAWGAGILGVALGLVTAFCFALSTGLIAV